MSLFLCSSCSGEDWGTDKEGNRRVLQRQITPCRHKGEEPITYQGWYVHILKCWNLEKNEMVEIVVSVCIIISLWGFLNAHWFNLHAVTVEGKIFGINIYEMWFF